MDSLSSTAITDTASAGSGLHGLNFFQFKQFFFNLFGHQGFYPFWGGSRQVGGKPGKALHDFRVFHARQGEKGG
jgi:hypothetical protein